MIVLLVMILWTLFLAFVYVIWIDHTRSWRADENEPNSEWKNKRNDMIKILSLVWLLGVAFIGALLSGA